MTNFEYASRINKAVGLDLSLDCEEIDLQDKLYGLFQCFMPEGAGVEAVFVPLQNGTELQARIIRSTQSRRSKRERRLVEAWRPGIFVRRRIRNLVTKRLRA